MAKIDFNMRPGEYVYEQDELGKHNYGVLKSGATSERDPVAQRNAGGLDREAGDHGGHLIPHRYGGRNDATNLDAQHANVNQRGQAHVEREVASLVNDPNKTVFWDAQNYTGGTGQRPTATMITVAVQDSTTGQVDVVHHSFQNASYEEQAQWEEMANQDVEIDPRQDIGMTAEERALANEYADMPYESETLGTGYAVSFDEDPGVSTDSVDDGVDDGMDDGMDDGLGM